MATELGALQWTIIADDSDFKRKLSESSSRMDGFKGYLSALATASSQKFAAGLFGVATGLGGAAIAAVKSASDMEMLRSNLDTLTGSAQTGGEMYKKLYDFAAKTPFETGELAKATSTMLSFGISNDKVMGNLKMLGDVSMGNKEKLQSLTLAFSQVQSTGRLMGQDLLQMINQGFNPLTIIAQKTGKSMATLKKEMEDGKISADMVTDAFKTATSEGGLFFNGMDRGANTLQGLWSTLMDTTGSLTRKLVGLSETGEIIQGGLFDKVKTGIKTVTDYISSNQDVILGFVQKAFGWLKDNGDIVAGIIVGGLTPAAIALSAALLAASAPLIPWLALGGGLVLLYQEMKEHQEVLMAKAYELRDSFLSIVSNVWDKIKPAFDFLSFVFTNLWNQLKDQLWPQMMRFRDSMDSLHKILDPYIIPALEFLGYFLGGIVVAAIAGAVLAFQGILWVFTKMLESVNNTIDGFVRFVNFVKDLPNKISGAVEKVKGIIDRLNPFHRESPSLVDNVRRGLGVISKEYANMQLSLPNVNVADLGNMQIGAQSQRPQQVTNSPVHVHVGMFAGGQQELRKIVETITTEQSRIASARGAA